MVGKKKKEGKKRGGGEKTRPFFFSYKEKKCSFWAFDLSCLSSYDMEFLVLDAKMVLV